MIIRLGKRTIENGDSLNFKVLGSQNEPSGASENTIWVNTDVPITGYVFNADQPANPSEGMVWIKTGTQSAAAFNALKSNTIMVYPLSAKQYTGGAWVDVTAKSYQGGAWVNWIKRLEFIANGVANYEYSLNVGSGAVGVKVTEHDGYISLDSSESLYHGIVFRDIQLEDQTTLRIEGTLTGNTTRLAVWPNTISVPGEDNCIAYADVNGASGALDVSKLEPGLYILGFTFRYGNTEQIANLWLE